MKHARKICLRRYLILKKYSFNVETICALCWRVSGNLCPGNTSYIRLYMKAPWRLRASRWTPPRLEVPSVYELKCLLAKRRTVRLPAVHHSLNTSYWISEVVGFFFFCGVVLRNHCAIMNPPCGRCNKPVYPTEKINCLDKVRWDKSNPKISLWYSNFH